MSSSDSDSAASTTAARSQKKRKRDTTKQETAILAAESATPSFVDLGGKRRVTVSEFHRALLVDIREFYEAQGELRPGKKGISLTIAQWEELKRKVERIDALIAKAKGDTA